KGVEVQDGGMDVIGELFASPSEVLVIRQGRVDAQTFLHQRVDLETPALEALQDLPVAVESHTLHLPDAVAEEIQRTSSGDARIELPQGSGGRVAGISKCRLPLFSPAGV